MLGPRSGERMLEIGFGPGEGLAALAQAVGDRGKVYGLDISPKMLRVAKSKLDRRGLARRVELEIGDGADLPFGKGVFDGVFLSFVLELFDTPEIPEVLAECARVLRPDGRISVVSLAKPEDPAHPGMMTRLYEWAHKKAPGLIDCRPIFVEAALEEAGFEVTRQKRSSMWGIPVTAALGVARSASGRL